MKIKGAIMDKEHASKKLRRIIREFDDKNWGKLTTTKDLCDYIIANGFNYGADHNENTIVLAIELINMLSNNSEGYIVPSDVALLKKFLKKRLGEAKNEN